MGYLNSLNGGIIIGIGLFILLPESKETFETYFESNHSTDEKLSPWEEMPYAFFVSFFIYSFLLFSEKVILSKSVQLPEIHDHDHHHYDDVENDSDIEEEVLKNVVSTKGKFASFLQVRNRKQ
jgi:hypothetical protein